MPVQQIAGFIFVALISAMSACDTTIPSENQERNVTIFDEGKDLHFFELVSSVDKTTPAFEGFEKRPSGLQYRILREGTGPKPTARDHVLAHYKGQLINGKEFDSSYKRNQPSGFPLSGVIGGWTEGLQFVGEGGMIELVIPSELGYGEGGTQGIPGGATLQFIIELQKVN
ncbi:FKBP-type peptidyl-prolyl cis-trans isomerase FkpA precursor [hydrothermal vent metagenome]|uniref:peptidylprolyl isomerase n=1 Tax=hydrothermal vent metagenome TaxID=652676 RepID=A0A3B1DPQ3_9ZZZZ